MKNTGITKTYIILVALVIGLISGPTPPAIAHEMIDWGGSWEGAAETSFYDDSTEIRTSGGLRLQARTLTYPWRVFFDGSAGINGPLGGDGEWETRGTVDRLYLRLYLPSADITLGKQFVNWGVGYAWAPTDVFNPPDPANPEEQRPGITAAVLQIPVGPLDYWSLALAEEKYGLRRRGNLSGTDWSVLAVSDEGDRVFGADLKGDFGVGWHLATAYRHPGEESADPTLRGLVGVDYSWLGGALFWVGEYLLETSGGSSGSTERHTFQQLTYRLDEFTSISGSLLAQLPAGRQVWNVGVNTSLGGQSQLSLGLALIGGESPPLPVPTLKARLSVELSQAF